MKLNISKTDWVMRSTWTEAFLLMLWVKSRWVIWSESMVRTMNKVFP